MARPSKAAQHAARAQNSLMAASTTAQIPASKAAETSHASIADSAPVDAHPLLPPTESTLRSDEALFDPLLTTDEVSLWLRKPKGTLYAWRSRGQGPQAFKVGNDLRYSRSEVRRWLEQTLEPKTA